jgi:hypothetical protein
VEITGSLNVSGSGRYTDGLTVTGSVIAPTITGSLLGTASYASNANLLDGLDSSVFTPTGSFNSYTASNDATVTSVAMSTALALASIATLTSKTGSYTLTSSFNSYTSSNDANVNCVSSMATAALVGVAALAARTGSYATTGSNTFDGGAYFSSSFNPTGFTTTASLYTDGGLRVTKDAYISGTLYLNNVTVFGTQSVAYISSSQLNIGTNIITVNTDTPSVRFGGLAVYDSGSTGLTGSILWDSQANHWVYSNPSGSSYSGGMFISGPRTAALGSETGTTSCMLLAGQGGDHLTSSMIYHSSTVTCIPNTLIGSTICTTMTNASCIGIGTSTPTDQLSIFNSTSNTPATLRLAGSNRGGQINFYNQSCPTAQINVDQSGNVDILTGIFNGSSISSKFSITNTGQACFACQVCSGGTFFSNVGATTSTYGLTHCGAGRWGRIGMPNASFMYLETNSDGGVYIDAKLQVNGISCFAGAVCVPNIISTGASGGRYATFNAPTNGGYITFEAGGTPFGDLGSYCAQYGTGDATTLSLQSRTGYALALGTNSTERLRIISTGAIGIGTSSPCSYASQTLHVNSPSGASTSIKVTNTTTTTGVACGLDILQSNSDTYIYNRSVGLIELGTSNAARLTIASTGIACFACQVCSPSSIIKGTINEQLVLDFVAGAGSYTHQSFRLCGTNQYRLIGNTNGNFILRNDIISSDVLTFACAGGATFACSVKAVESLKVKNNSSNVSYLEFERNSNTQAFSFIEGNGENTTGFLKFWTSDTTRLTILGNGNVGIGTTSPAYKFVVSNSGAAGLEVDPVSPTIAGGVDLLFYNRSTSAYKGASFLACQFYFGGGNVGIGVTNPNIYGNNFTKQVTISNTDSSQYANISMAGGSGASGGIDFGNQTVRHAGVYGLNGSDLGFYTNGSNSGNGLSERMRITSTGSTVFQCSVCLATGTVYLPGAIGGRTAQIEFGNSGTIDILGMPNQSSSFYLKYGCNSILFTNDSGGEILRMCCNRTIAVNGPIVPTANGTIDLGTSSLRWNTVFTSDLSLSNGIGDYTIVEGENDLFLYNNKQCKVYRFMLEQVCAECATPKKS